MLTPLSYFIVVTGAAECIAQALEDHVADGTLGRPGRVGGTPSPDIAWDGCECGRIAVTIVRGPFPSTRFPAENADTPESSSCFLGVTATPLIASLTRCQYHPTANPATQKPPPTMIQQQEALRLQQIEQYYMRQALLCCLPDMMVAGIIDDWRVGGSAYAINGACGEVSIPFLVQVI